MARAGRVETWHAAPYRTGGRNRNCGSHAARSARSLDVSPAVRALRGEHADPVELVELRRRPRFACCAVKQRPDRGDVAGACLVLSNRSSSTSSGIVSRSSGSSAASSTRTRITSLRDTPRASHNASRRSSAPPPKRTLTNFSAISATTFGFRFHTVTRFISPGGDGVMERVSAGDRWCPPPSCVVAIGASLRGGRVCTTS